MAVGAMYFTIETIVFFVETIFLEPRRFSQKRNDRLRPETDFFITEKIAGEAPTTS